MNVSKINKIINERCGGSAWVSRNFRKMVKVAIGRGGSDASAITFAKAARLTHVKFTQM